jgi:hypothetical protein
MSERYEWGKVGPAGFDCSGWVRLAIEDPQECAERLLEVVRRAGGDPDDLGGDSGPDPPPL